MFSGGLRRVQPKLEMGEAGCLSVQSHVMSALCWPPGHHAAASLRALHRLMRALRPGELSWT